MLAKPIDDVTLADRQALVDHNIPESRRLEFKRDHYGRKDDDRREFAADVSAMANAQGGDLIIGIIEVMSSIDAGECNGKKTISLGVSEKYAMILVNKCAR